MNNAEHGFCLWNIFISGNQIYLRIVIWWWYTGKNKVVYELGATALATTVTKDVATLMYEDAAIQP